MQVFHYKLLVYILPLFYFRCAVWLSDQRQVLREIAQQVFKYAFTGVATRSEIFGQADVFLVSSTRTTGEQRNKSIPLFLYSQQTTTRPSIFHFLETHSSKKILKKRETL